MVTIINRLSDFFEDSNFESLNLCSNLETLLNSYRMSLSCSSWTDNLANGFVQSIHWGPKVYLEDPKTYEPCMAGHPRAPHTAAEIPRVGRALGT